VDASESITQGLSKEAINALVPEVDPCRIVLADLDA